MNSEITYVHVPEIATYEKFGKLSEKELKENIDTIIEAVNKKQIERAYLTSTMSPSVKIDLAN